MKSENTRRHSGQRRRRAAPSIAWATQNRALEFGNATVRNPNARGPWFLSENVSLARTFGVNATRLELRLEVFNLLDRKVWGSPDSSLTSQNFGRVTTLANSPRQVQLGLRFEF